LGEKFGVKGFPTLKFFRNGQHSEYNGGRTEATIIAWLTKKLGPASVQVSSEAEILSKKAKGPVVVFFGSEDEQYNTFLNVASNFEDL
jgi:protein disulfide-isomerase A1